MARHLGVQVWRRVVQASKLWRDEGSQGLIDRARHAAARRIAPGSSPRIVRPEDVLAADLSKPKSWTALRGGLEKPFIINWVTTPPVKGSGGHATMFRLIDHFERLGHLCRVYIYDVHGRSLAYCRALVKEVFPNVNGPIADVTEGMAGAHAVIATSWQTAYPVFNDICEGMRFYLVQDFEPWFYPVGAYSLLAENTYKMGFHGITAGKFLSTKLTSDYGMSADFFEFGCDTDKYHLETGRTREGVAFYSRSETPRRAFELGVLALDIFARRHPNLHIHLYGGRITGLPFRYTDHGVISPRELNELYNCCFAGLSLSMTNVSLVPHEMLSAGCIPVVNDAEHNRMVLDNPFVRYAAATPQALASALSDLVTMNDFSSLATKASASVSSMSWAHAGTNVEGIIRAKLDPAG